MDLSVKCLPLKQEDLSSDLHLLGKKLSAVACTSKHNAGKTEIENVLVLAGASLVELASLRFSERPCQKIESEELKKTANINHKPLASTCICVSVYLYTCVCINTYTKAVKRKDIERNIRKQWIPQI